MIAIRRSTLLVLTALMLGVLSVGGPTVPAVDAAPEGQITYGVHITVAARFLDPQDSEGIATPFMVLSALHDAMLKPMPSGPFTPSLAELYTASKDGLTYDFTIRKRAKFHNDEPVTADDVKFSFERYRGAGSRILKEKVREIQVVDAGHVRFRMKEPWPDFLTFYGTMATGSGWIVPKKYVEKVGDDGFKRSPVGAGPYKFVSFNPGVELVVEAFEGYWRKVPNVKRIVFRTIPEESTRAAALKKGEVDIAYLLTGPTAEEIKRTPNLKLVAPLLDGIFWVDFPDQWDPKSPWHDARVRLAASLAIDRQAINQAETLGFSKVTGALIPAHYDFALPFEAPAQDVKKARQLLTEAGYPNGFDAGDFTPFPPYFSMGEAIVGYLQAIGIKSRVKTMERAAFQSAWRDKKLHGLILGITAASGNAATRLESYVTKTGIYAYGVLPEVEDLFERQVRELDRKKREALLHQIQKILHDKTMHAPIYQLGFISGVGPRLAEAGLGSLRGYPYSAPYEDVRVKK